MEPPTFDLEYVACGAATLENGERVAVAAGGCASSGCAISEISSTVEIYSVSRGGYWTRGPDLPLPLSFSSVVQMRDSFLLVGGLSSAGSQAVDTGVILEFDPTTLGWITREQTLATPRYAEFVVAVDKDKYCF